MKLTFNIAILLIPLVVMLLAFAVLGRYISNFGFIGFVGSMLGLGLGITFFRKEIGSVRLKAISFKKLFPMILLLLFLHSVYLGLTENQVWYSGEPNDAINVFYLITILFVVPLGEEVFFRALAFERLIKLFKSQSSVIVVTTTVFAIGHLPGISSFLYYFFIGLYLIMIYRSTKNVIYCIILHAISNALPYFHLLFQGIFG